MLIIIRCFMFEFMIYPIVDFTHTHSRGEREIIRNSVKKKGENHSENHFMFTVWTGV